MPIRRRANPGTPSRGTSGAGGADNFRVVYAMEPASQLRWIVATVRATSFAANNSAQAEARLVAYIRSSSPNDPPNTLATNTPGNIGESSAGEGRLIAEVDIGVATNNTPALIPLHGIVTGPNEEVVIEGSDLAQNDNSSNGANWCVNLLAESHIQAMQVR